MEIYIKDGKINFNKKGEKVIVNDDFFENYKNNIETYNFIIINGKIIEDNNENKIKQKYQDLIFGKYSLTDQLNMSNEAVQITALAQFEKRDFTEDETLKLLEIQEAKKWIDEQRELCKQEIENL